VLNLQLGPLALPLNPLLMLAGWWLASWIADRMSAAGPARGRLMAARALLLAAAVGLLASRIGFVALAWPAYAAEPWTLLNLRDGGWMPWAGLAAALGVLLGFAWRYPHTRRALAAGASAGLVLWGVTSQALGVHRKPDMPALQLQALDGLPVRLQPDGRPTVINIWATWCAPCRDEMPILARAQQQHADIRFVFVNHGETAATVQRWLSRQPYVLGNVMLDPEQAVAAAAGTTGLPTTLFLDARGRMLQRHFGPLSGPSLAVALAKLR
jgi:thiol-disulfide isomerase/thioredoxin